MNLMILVIARYDRILEEPYENRYRLWKKLYLRLKNKI